MVQKSTNKSQEVILNLYINSMQEYKFHFQTLFDSGSIHSAIHAVCPVTPVLTSRTDNGNMINVHTRL